MPNLEFGTGRRGSARRKSPKPSQPLLARRESASKAIARTLGDSYVQTLEADARRLEIEKNRLTTAIIIATKKIEEALAE